MRTYEDKLLAAGVTDERLREFAGDFPDPPPQPIHMLLALMTRLGASIEAVDKMVGRFGVQEYRDAVEAIGLSKSAAARFFGVGDVTARRWASRDTPPASVAGILSLMILHKLSPRQVTAWLRESA